MNLINYMFLIMLFISMFMFTYLFHHLLLTLMMLEFIMLNLLMLMNFFLFSLNYNEILYYLTFVVCENVLSLTILISLIRNYGNDNLNFLNLIW